MKVMLAPRSMTRDIWERRCSLWMLSKVREAVGLTANLGISLTVEIFWIVTLLVRDIDVSKLSSLSDDRNTLDLRH